MMTLHFNELLAYMNAVEFCVQRGLTFEGHDTDEYYVLTLTGGF